MATSDYERVEAAIRFIESRATEQPGLEEIAAHLELSPFHVQRLFKRWAGVSPKRFLQALTAERARERLCDAASVLDAAYDAGLSGPGRLHDLMVAVEAMTPGEIKTRGKGLEIRHGRHDTPFGPAHIAMTERGVCGLAFGDADATEAWPNARRIEDADATALVVERVFEGSSGRRIPVLLGGTNLQLQVWRALLRIPEGALVSYGSLASALGRPGSARAVANAVGANAIGYLIPCHRVLRETGAVSGYRWGTERKRAMLGRELAERETGHLV